MAKALFSDRSVTCTMWPTTYSHEKDSHSEGAHGMGLVLLHSKQFNFGSSEHTRAWYSSPESSYAVLEQSETGSRNWLIFRPILITNWSNPTVPNCLNYFVPPEQRICLNQLFLAPEVNADVISNFFPTQIGKIVGKSQLKFSRMSEKCVKVNKIVEKIRQIRLYLSRTKGLFEPIKVENYRNSYKIKSENSTRANITKLESTRVSNCFRNQQWTDVYICIFHGQQIPSGPWNRLDHLFADAG